ncbi:MULTISPECIES: hypothetical protein [Streptomyces]|uniref:Uncharacterized protein n=2 Tax=Streptomyces TaxID=1883 RepID=A0A100Y997_9ACTN|nr:MULTISPECIES: hypothetical protein [Streptomyces]KUH39973.1 hypothetical protein ATE80_04040 [Streptomyces kanasensis]UUS29629.1 hypothetical protein NRO40_01440 [Streptomyces changanensis]
MKEEPETTSRPRQGGVSPDAILHSGAEGEFTAEDLVLASGRDVNPKNMAWAERRLAEKGRAALDELLP